MQECEAKCLKRKESEEDRGFQQARRSLVEERISFEPNSPCSLPADAGPCPETLVRYFYDGQHGRCAPFWFGGCGGNNNNFPDEESCKEACP